MKFETIYLKFEEIFKKFKTTLQKIDIQNMIPKHIIAVVICINP